LSYYGSSWQFSVIKNIKCTNKKGELESRNKDEHFCWYEGQIKKKILTISKQPVTVTVLTSEHIHIYWWSKPCIFVKWWNGLSSDAVLK
jgi:hypothetical protein